jgi:hypothetical protein
MTTIGNDAFGGLFYAFCGVVQTWEKLRRVFKNHMLKWYRQTV